MYWKGVRSAKFLNKNFPEYLKFYVTCYIEIGRVNDSHWSQIPVPIVMRFCYMHSQIHASAWISLMKHSGSQARQNVQHHLATRLSVRQS
jgi:hypothetical protein